MTPMEIGIAVLVAALLVVFYALMAARAWQRDCQQAIEHERSTRHERERTR